MCFSISIWHRVLELYSFSLDSPVSHSGVVRSASASPLIIMVRLGSTPSVSYRWMVDLVYPYPPAQFRHGDVDFVPALLNALPDLLWGKGYVFIHWLGLLSSVSIT